MVINWKDITSYTKTEKERLPRSFQSEGLSATLTVHRHRDYDGEQWLLSVYSLGINNQKLKSKDTIKAQKEAIDFLKNKLQGILAELE
jgi:hypothetical protein